MSTRQRIALIGPGAIGCCLAAALLEQGHDVAIGARQPFARLTLVHGEITREFSAHCATSPADLAGADLVVLATKAHQTPGARDWLAAATSNGAPVLIAQNGVDHVERLRAVLGSSDPERVPLVPAVVYLPAHRTAPGHAVLEGRASLTLPAGASAQRFADAFGQGMVRIDLVDDWLTAAWMKLLMNAVSGAISAPLGRTIDVLADPGAAELARAMIKEAVPVGRAEGARLDDAACDRIVDNMVKFAGSHYPSITQDRRAGVPTEWRARNEVIVRLAERHGLSAPINKALTTMLRLGEPLGAA